MRIGKSPKVRLPSDDAHTITPPNLTILDMKGWIVIALLLVGPIAKAAVPSAVTTFFKTYCIDCHGPKKQEGDFRVDELRISATAADAENLSLIHI